MKNNAKAISMAILAAALYGISSPASKLLLYIGVGLGTLAINIHKHTPDTHHMHLH